MRTPSNIGHLLTAARGLYAPVVTSAHRSGAQWTANRHQPLLRLSRSGLKSHSRDNDLALIRGLASVLAGFQRWLGTTPAGEWTWLLLRVDEEARSVEGSVGGHRDGGQTD
jgi:hypothetical protein